MAESRRNFREESQRILNEMLPTRSHNLAQHPQMRPRMRSPADHPLANVQNRQIRPRMRSPAHHPSANVQNRQIRPRMRSLAHPSHNSDLNFRQRINSGDRGKRSSSTHSVDNFRGHNRQPQNIRPKGAPQYSNESQNSESRPHFEGRNRRQRSHHIGYKALESLLSRPPDEVVLNLLSEQSGYSLLLEETTIRDDLLILMMRVLCRATEANSNRNNLMQLLEKSFCPNVKNILVSFSLKVINDTPERSSTFFECLATIGQKFIEVRPYRAISILKEIIGACLMALNYKNLPHLQKVQESLEMLQNAVENMEKEFLLQATQKRDRSLCIDDRLEPPDDFREITVIPDNRDVYPSEKPFLRKNIINGRYSDANHYLDVQFRLLREDFVRPLREGILQHHSDSRKKNHDLRIYRRVQLNHLEIVNREFTYFVKVEFSKNFRPEASKSLLYGNFICLSSDSFKTFLCGYVFERKPELLKKGLLGLKFESSKDVPTMSVNYEMAESRAYFIPYKHVLEALQRIPDDKLPFSRYLVEVDSHINAPTYLNRIRVFNLESIPGIPTTEEDDQIHLNIYRTNALRQVNVLSPLILWPSSEILSLDDSQRRALHGGLTREFSIIQGPPGTGKTFLGLKITQALLQNISDDCKPIVVICYTNHALDQFLEGISHFTQSIVRVGGRSKSEIIQNYNISLLLRKVNLPHNIFKLKMELTDQTRYLESDIQMRLSEIHELSSPKGIFQMNFIKEVVPPWALEQFKKHNCTMVDWLLEPNGYSFFEQDQDYQATEEEEESEESDQDEWQDAMELMEEEEASRGLTLDLDVKFKSNVQSSILVYDIKLEDFSKMIRELKYESQFDSTASNNFMELYMMQSEIMQRGLKVKPDNSNSKKPINIFWLGLIDRWSLYNSWIEELKKIKSDAVQKESKQFELSIKQLSELSNQQYLHVMRQANVIGLTTTGAAKLNSVLQDLAPKIVIIEEAAEILESHVVASLSSSCEHLIMIGDHQQLKPSTTVYELAKKYNLETSLFERLIKNDFPFETLEYQHRMRPEISSLIVPSIYESLKDHPSVSNYDHIKGVTKDVFFIDHKHFEKSVSDENNSHENEHEAGFIIALCRYLVLQGYGQDEITILTPYSGQFFLLKRKQRSDPICGSVRICVVDNFQGEENKIILLSLVRSNPQAIVGFLKTENRVCVALSRAKMGLYICGNMEQLCQSSELWKKIRTTLDQNQSIGRDLVLRCSVHPDSFSYVSSEQDILNKNPEGGCRLQCGDILECGHTCHRTCHIRDRQHKNLPCMSPCSRILCTYGHLCPKICSEQCGPCRVPMMRNLPCGHLKELQCYINPADYFCKEKVNKVLPDCGHENEIECSADIKKHKCSFPCEVRLDCGHQCKQNCHVKVDPDHEHYRCEEPCALLNKGCTVNHQCRKKCYEPCGNCITIVSKTLPCGHTHSKVPCYQEVKCHYKCQKKLDCGHPCPMMCSEPCGNCDTLVLKVIPDCNHTAKLKCGKRPSSSDCAGKCTKILPCGHPCKNLCKQPCTSECTVLVPSSKTCPKNHNISLPCHIKGNLSDEEASLYCRESCNIQLNCEHFCKGQCGTCLHGRVHVPCEEKCGRTLVCGHICTSPCSEECPPCDKKCPLKCHHSKCFKTCGMPCTPCKQVCIRSCPHQKCTSLCGSACSVSPCDKPCPKKLKCGHDCVGFCGENCPNECRICDPEKLTEFILFGYEEEEDARFVKLEDCGHAIESQALDHWMNMESEEIGMKKCPRCQTLLYNCSRYKKKIFEAYQDVCKVKFKNFSSQSNMLKKHIKEELEDIGLFTKHQEKRTALMKKSGTDPNMSQKAKKRLVPDPQLKVCLFKAQILRQVAELEKKHSQSSSFKQIEVLINFILKRYNQIQAKVSLQISEEFSWELKRLSLLPSIAELNQRCISGEGARICQQIKAILAPTTKLNGELEAKVRSLLKEGEGHVGGLGIPDEERRMVVQAMGFQKGHWYKCPKGHIYAIGDCGGATMQSTCPECRATIGGSGHRLRDDNAVATEMDGGTRPAYPYNHI